ncbi:MAG: chaperone modulator CbpM [Bacteroidia bacterium]|nr:chaperone modulator CbpM [Bacteroidia bacterium]
MEPKLIAVEECCRSYNIEFTFLESLNEFGLIEIVPVDDNRFLPEEQLKDLERMIRLHDELGINMAGIDAISHLLKRVDDLQREIQVLKSHLY